MRVTTDSGGDIVAQSGHYPYGESWYETGGANKLKFTSYERDSETGNDYAMFRSHIPRLGRFNRPDPIAGSIANPQSLNRYTYVQNNPVNATDPLGLFMINPGGGGGGGWGLRCGVNSFAFFDEGGNPHILSITVECIEATFDLPGIFQPQGGGTGGGGSGGARSVVPGADRAVQIANEIVSGDNECADFFDQNIRTQGSDFFKPGLADESFVGDLVTGFDMISGSYVRMHVTTSVENRIEETTAAHTQQGPLENGGTIFLNPNGAFFNRTSSRGGVFNIGGFEGGSLGAQVAILLHEYAHITGAIPHDGRGDPDQSRRNTEAVLSACLGAIRAAIAGVP